MDLKSLVGQEIAKRVKDGQIIGVGTGSTVAAALLEIGKRVAEKKLNIAVVPTSLDTTWLCESLGLKVLLPSRQELAWGFDGADAVNSRLWAIKGRGGAMLREKIMAARCQEYLLAIDESKFTDDLAGKSPVPVEIVPEAIMIAERGLAKLGAKEIKLRKGSGIHGPVLTEAGNVIMDVVFSEIHAGLEKDIKSLVGVVESGLFLDYATAVLMGTKQGIKTLVR